ncbi:MULTISPECIES: MFS transporter [unclassified Coleofasciculus]|uniref:MFS transporter n=1 Tax=Cyanophyceae TaxID=3028117 RepID=UPI0016838307|nr:MULTISPECIES: MFS transporter [unclassified Coleofasciculus]MBD2084847.1 MFS transporter [Coleofasciculus sp. FACHB-542]MBD2539200.1 MFS transporter [Coleofasciculus sp. FACHB-SPT36]
MKVFWTLEPPSRRNLLVLFTAGLLFWSSMASLLPTLPLYIEDVGGTTQQIGIVMGSFALGLVLCRSWLGRLADRRGRKVVLLIGMTVAAIAPLGYLVVKSIPLLMLLRAFHGISIAAFTTGYSALVVDLSPVSKRGELIGYMSLVTPVGMAIGPAVGGYIQAGVGYTPLFLLSCALGAIGLVCANQVKEPRIVHETTDSSAGSSETQQFWRLLASPRLRIPALVLLLVGVAFGALSTFVPLFIKDAEVDLNPGLFYTAAAIASFISRIIIGRASDRYGRGIFITGSIFSYALAMLMLSHAYTARSFLVGGFLEGAGAGTLLPMMIALISDRSSPQERGRVFALCITGFDVGIAIAGPVLGSIAEPIGYRAMFTITTVISFLALIIFATLSSKNLSHSLRFAFGREKDVYALNKVGLQSEA